MLRTRLCDLLGVDHPLISAPMAGTATAELAAAVSNAGGLGTIGASDARGRPEQAGWLRDQIRATRERTDRPCGVGFILSYPGLEELIRVALEERVAAVAYSFGDPTPYVAPAHAVGTKVLVQVQTVAQARTAAAAGADAIAAQGSEGGGHTGAHGTLSFVPAVVDAIEGIPVIAAGGIADGRGLAAALLLGAEGAWLGTHFVASQEWAGGEWRKARVVAAGTDDTVWTRTYDLGLSLPFPDGIGGRVLRNAFTDTWHGREAEVVAQRTELRAQLEAAAEVVDPDVEAVWAGAAAGLIQSVEPAGEIVRRIVAEAEHLLKGRPSQVLR